MVDAPEVLLAVDGLPPAKSEARSMFGESHPHRSRVLALLQEAHDALEKTQWNPVEERPVGLELVVVNATDSLPGDATNYLGGVADVLQATRVNADLSHLGSAGSTSLYRDDRQIREVHYSVEDGIEAAYRLRVWVL